MDMNAFIPPALIWRYFRGGLNYAIIENQNEKGGDFYLINLNLPTLLGVIFGLALTGPF